MKTKTWQKDLQPDELVEKFTVGKDREYDLYLAPFDIMASAAHTRMLGAAGLISREEAAMLEKGLEVLAEQVQQGTFALEEGVEDIHSQLELSLTRMYGEAGKKIHTARSRNDQVLTAIKLYLRSEMHAIREKTLLLVSLFKELAHEYNGVLLPGYTHFQVAMPSSFDLWFYAYAESLEDDLILLQAAWDVCDKNPLGSAAGFGSSFPVDREMTTAELGFGAMNRSSVYAQMTRGKSEKIVSCAISSIAHSLSRFSYDVCLYLCQNFSFISFPENLTTGSSIMPHKKNPDVFELVRGRCNVLQGLPQQLTLLTNNLPSGYHRDMQLTKELIIPAINEIKDCLDILLHVLPSIEVKQDILSDPRYQHLFTVEAVNELVLQGVSFRDAYHTVARKVQEGSFQPPSDLKYTHTGSIGNVV